MVTAALTQPAPPIVHRASTVHGCTSVAEGVIRVLLLHNPVILIKRAWIPQGLGNSNSSVGVVYTCSIGTLWAGRGDARVLLQPTVPAEVNTWSRFPSECFPLLPA